jgi:hypothetical protein
LYVFSSPTLSHLVSHFISNFKICYRFGAAGKEHEKFIYNDAAFLLAMAIANGALFRVENLDDIKKQEIPPGDNELVL